MEKSEDKVRLIPYPRLVSAAFFGIFAILATLFVLFILNSFGINQGIPLIPLVSFSLIIFTVFGALFGKKIIHTDKNKKFKIFLYGFFLILAALPFYDMLVLYYLQNSEAYAIKIDDARHLMLVYGFIVLYSLFGIGFWLAILSGFAALYLRRNFLYHWIQSNPPIKHSTDKKLKK